MDVCNVSIVAAEAHISPNVVFMRAVMEAELVYIQKDNCIKLLDQLPGSTILVRSLRS
jgi:hypothetical protein